jgi:hypothetical protein
VECEALVPVKPSSHIGMLVGGVVVEHARLCRPAPPFRSY